MYRVIIDYKRLALYNNVQVERNNKLENSKHFEYKYRIRDYVKRMYKKNSRMRSTKLSPPSEGPY